MEEKYFSKIDGGEKQEVIFTNREKSRGTIGGKDFDWDIITTGENRFHIISNGKSYNAEVVKANYEEKSITVKVNGHIYTVEVEDRFDALLKRLGMADMLEGIAQDIKAPMPGLVLDIYVEEGQEITKDEPVIVLEAMKMENVLKAPGDAKVKEVKVEKGQAVEKNTLLISFE